LKLCITHAAVVTRTAQPYLAARHLTLLS
jgi:hypothetical protein